MLGYDKGIRRELSRNIWAAMLLLPIVILNVLQWRRCVDNRKESIDSTLSIFSLYASLKKSFHSPTYSVVDRSFKGSTSHVKKLHPLYLTKILGSNISKMAYRTPSLPRPESFTPPYGM